MKNSYVLAILALAFGTGSAFAVYTDTANVYQYSIGGTIAWTHSYDFSETAPLTATLTIVADDVDGPGNGMDGEQDRVRFWGTDSAWHDLGLLNDMGFYSNFSYYSGPGNPNQPLTTTVFSLNPSWINWSMPVQVIVEASWGVEIETSTLEITGSRVPEGGSSLLMFGCALVGVAGFRKTLAQ
jgi:hypothetical protein